ncbi:hypothetical protein [Brasilonema bromeliae]|uniref:hypothetical protein n=1 Tax=Brasilonema bromeliae TaxID=383615 RepID=UPI00145CF1E8|nr:hypothetical protein [Brasilonema bromeliae]
MYSLGQALQLVNRSSGNSFIADIPNAQLRLPSGKRQIPDNFYEVGDLVYHEYLGLL